MNFAKFARRPSALLATLAAVVALVVPASANATTPARSAATDSNPNPGLAVHFQQHTGASREIVLHTLEDQFAAIRTTNASKRWDVYLTMFDLRDTHVDTAHHKAANITAGYHDVVDQLLTSIQHSNAIVHVVLDHHQAPNDGRPECDGTFAHSRPDGWTPATARLYCIATLGGHRSTRFVSCANSCISGSGHSIMHNKFVLFRPPTGTQRVLMSSSANWTPIQLDNYYQTLSVMRGSNALVSNTYHQWYLYWLDLARKANHVPADTTVDGVTSAFFPRSNDPQVSELEKITCEKGDEIQLRSNNFNNPRLVMRLKTLRNEGCIVHVLADAGGLQVSHSGVPERCVPRLHQKDLIIDAHYKLKDGHRTPDLSVWTGSHPFGPAFASAGDADLRLHGAFWVKRFSSDFAPVYSHAPQDGAAC